MDEDLTDALVAAGCMLAEALRAGLLARGLPSALSVTVKDGRVVVSSASREVSNREVGTSATPPEGTMEAVARAHAPKLVAHMTAILQRADYERSF